MPIVAVRTRRGFKMDQKDADVVLAFLHEVVAADTPLRHTESFEAACEVFGYRPYFLGGGAMKPHIDRYLPEKL